MVISEYKVLSEDRFKAPRFPGLEGTVKASSKGKYDTKINNIYIYIYYLDSKFKVSLRYRDRPATDSIV